MSNISIKQNVGEKEMSIKTEMDKMTINQDKMRERIFFLSMQLSSLLKI